MKTVNKHSIIFLILCIVSWQSVAGAILKTNSAYYESIIGTEFHDGDRRSLTSQGDLFYALDANNKFNHFQEFTKKYIKHYGGPYHSNENYSHYSGIDINASTTTLDFGVWQDSDLLSPGDSFAFEDFSFSWQFDVIDDDALMNMVFRTEQG
ncbi:hypothetical protein [Psychromonas sp. MME1]|uniref:hypothetical protein n=1 Tax=Psychromonas sp. MME1 TaxID=3231032 RepID=UPI0034E21560